MFPGITPPTREGLPGLWHLNPWAEGAYTARGPASTRACFGAGSTPEGRIHFAGEHTSGDYFGFLNGAVGSGERAAKEVALVLRCLDQAHGVARAQRAARSQADAVSTATTG